VSTELPVRIPVVGTPISVTTIDELLRLVDSRPSDRATVVAFCNVHSVMTARRSSDVAEALNRADIAAPDGMPVAWGLRAAGIRNQPRVDGPTFLRRALLYGVNRNWKHFFFGSTPETLAKVIDGARGTAPGIQIAGSVSPPFHEPTDQDIAEAASRIVSSGADVVWVGLGMPKQELWMHRARSHLPGVALLGVGAAFDFIAGTSPRAPAWMQASGLEWLHRFSQEPRRLWRRYLVNNPMYLALLTKDMTLDRLKPGSRRKERHVEPGP
jgi:N-acetylglucosaminyldiphosphoundecaprenol N-acetyl-beta-D-mannosaminyltransferase